MRFVDHKLEGHWRGRAQCSDAGLTSPTLLVIHYTASGGKDASGDTKFFQSTNAKASAHFNVGRDGSIDQVVECDRKAWHAGKSIWRGRQFCNGFSMGIEVDNWGWLTKRADGKFYSHAGVEVSAKDVVEAKHKNPAERNRYWEAYPEAQVRAVIELIRAIKAAYPSIKEIVGHEDVSPGRKTDPGPAFPWSRVLSEVENRGDGPSEDVRHVTATRLNVRGGPEVRADNVLGQFRNGTQVVVLYDAPGGWALIRGIDAEHNTLEGWVSDQFLR